MHVIGRGEVSELIWDWWFTIGVLFAFSYLIPTFLQWKILLHLLPRGNDDGFLFNDLVG